MIRKYFKRLKILTIQERIWKWGVTMAGMKKFNNTNERVERFLEKALELAQSLGYPEDAVHRIVSYVYARQRGNPAQEFAGTMTTLAALAEHQYIDLFAVTEEEMQRIWKKIDRIRIKNADKPTFIDDP